ncbi:MAG TPA: beta-ketoacyl-[acyl-carrier-protein] synthase II, partial [Bacillota bacterium]|nr:beta-ketoacyl-[acyl-carrier-protein] synthase II [Bacillota bacterium]
SSDGAILAITKALKNSNLAITDIGYINLHGTGTKLNDKAEINAVNTVFKQVVGQIIANSTKSITGHLLGTAGSIEFLISMLALLHNTIPPAMNIVQLDPDIEFQVNCGAPVSKELKHVLTNAFGFGGNNIAMILSKI